MLVAFIQMDCQFGRKEQNIDRAVDLIFSQNAHLYVLPELFNTGYLFDNQKEAVSLAEDIPDGKTTQTLIRLAGEKNCYIIAGLAELCDNGCYNSSILVMPDKTVKIYRKIHLFNEEKIWFLPGDQPFRVYDIGPAKLGLLICFDWIFPESMRSLALLGADIICHSANLVLPYCQSAMKTRCLENGVFAITANRIGKDIKNDRELSFTGKSQITNNKGEILAQADSEHEDVQVVEIEPKNARIKNLNRFNHLVNDRRPDFYYL